MVNPFDSLCADLRKMYKEKLSYDDVEAYRSVGFRDKSLSVLGLRALIKRYIDDYEQDQDSDSLGELSISDKSYKLMDGTTVSMVCATYEASTFYSYMSILLTDSSNSYVSVEDRYTIDVRTTLELIW